MSAPDDALTDEEWYALRNKEALHGIRIERDMEYAAKHDRNSLPLGSWQRKAAYSRCPIGRTGVACVCVGGHVDCGA